MGTIVSQIATLARTSLSSAALALLATTAAVADGPLSAIIEDVHAPSTGLQVMD